MNQPFMVTLRKGISDRGHGVNQVAVDNDDRRIFPRVPVQARMRVSHSRLGTLEGYSINVSDTGIFLRLSDLPRVPRGAHIGLQMLDSANPGIIFNTRVIHSSDNGLGVAIVDYELDGCRFTLDELRRQWQVSKNDMTYEHPPYAYRQ
ncbi:hypothetical protein MNBD_GAMMA21-1013 [hydrothermal vent metagenome]|uniref:PilZ domain-containing protein n=1 Tax=hydrothermal vent metagenome TaxID=652676 RepID=A0A3B1A9V8_9ZZZZ